MGMGNNQLNTAGLAEVVALKTLRQRASWLNERGRVDRSACLEVRVSEVWRLVEDWVGPGAPMDKWERKELAYRGLLENPLRAAMCKRVEAEAETGDALSRERWAGRVAHGVAVVWGALLERLMGRHLPRNLAGDWRTSRAPVMRRGAWRPGDGQRGKVVRGEALSRKRREAEARRVSGNALPVHVERSEVDPWKVVKVPKGRKGFCTRTMNDRPMPEADWGLDGNPNRGASREKVAGLGAWWWQPVRVERWKLKGQLTVLNYLVCPGVGWAERRGAKPQAAGERVYVSEETIRRDARLARLSTARVGKAKAQACRQQVLFLYLPLCTPAEHADAMTAQRWIAGLDERGRRMHRMMVEALEARYGLLFEPRCLLCRRCLGLRYGNNPETVRLYYQRMVRPRRALERAAEALSRERREVEEEMRSRKRRERRAG